ncbi:MAG: selenium-binding protein, partial [Gemmatimonadetes bacterium]
MTARRRHIVKRSALLLLIAALPAALTTARRGPEDESVFVRGLRPDQREAVLYVWTSDADQKDPDFLTTIDVNPKSPSYGKIIATTPTSSPANEAHHFGYTVNADRIFAGGLFSNRLFIYDVASDPKHPKLLKTVPDLAASTGYSGPNTFYAVPGGVLIAMLGSKDGGAPGGLVQLDNDGNFVKAMPAPNYMYDVGIKPELNLIVTSSWAHPHAVKAGNTPMDQVGDEVVVWDYKTGKVLQEEHLDKAPLEVRWLHGAAARGGFINCAFGNSLWYWEVGKDGKLVFTRVVKLADGSIPADMRI